MKLILYSNPGNGVLEKIENDIFPKNIKTVFGYMPADGADPKPEFEPFWRNLAKQHDADFVYIDNSRKPSDDDIRKIKSITSLAIMGGNVFSLLYNINLNGFKDLILELSEKPDFIYSGFSAGAMIVTPDIRLAGKEYGWNFGYDENFVGISNTNGLGFVEYEIIPHYKEEFDKPKLLELQNVNRYKIKSLSDNDFIIEEKKG